MEQKALILSNTNIANDIYQMELETDIAPLAKPGQFVQIRLDGLYLRRPISISWTDGNVLRIIYKIMGHGTDYLHTLKPGASLNLFGPLGTGFPIADQKNVLILGGGVGVPPLLKTAKAYLDKGAKVDVVLGFNTSKDVFYSDAFEQLGITPVICTMDGSVGVKGTVLDGVKEKGIDTTFVLACGPLPMLKAINSQYKEGYISLESRMGCGFGVCMGCVVNDVNGMSLRVCKNGPVFPVGKVVL
jgi:dihydroorotate dehydrogenase electron transfer subunit